MVRNSLDTDSPRANGTSVRSVPDEPEEAVLLAHVLGPQDPKSGEKRVSVVVRVDCLESLQLLNQSRNLSPVEAGEPVGVNRTEHWIGGNLVLGDERKWGRSGHPRKSVGLGQVPGHLVE